jgi:hypothetical protein
MDFLPIDEALHRREVGMANRRHAIFPADTRNFV